MARKRSDGSQKADEKEEVKETTPEATQSADAPPSDTSARDTAPTANTDNADNPDEMPDAPQDTDPEQPQDGDEKPESLAQNEEGLARPDIDTRAMVSVRLDNAPTAVLGGKAMFKGEVRSVTYAALMAALPHHPGKFSVKYPGSDQFVPAA